MYIHRFIIGIRFNDRMFRLQSLGGSVADELLYLRKSSRIIDSEYFTKVSFPSTRDNDYIISFTDDTGENSLSLQSDQFVFKKTSQVEGASVNIDNAIKEFELLWKTSNKVLKFHETRRIGFVGEFRIKKSEPNSAGGVLVESLTKLGSPSSCGRFHLTYEDRSLNNEGEYANAETDDFWNSIFGFYISDIDETPKKGYINANLDLQKYYNPAKVDPLKEFRAVREQFKKEKAKFKERVKLLGLTE